MTGALLGLFVLRPINDVVAWYEHEVYAPSPLAYVWTELVNSVHGLKPKKTALYALVGALAGLLTTRLYMTVYESHRRIDELTAELERDLDALIEAGESGSLEFKSSFRWDIKEQRTNRSLETVVMKSLAGFLNGRGGTLLIGVADDGRVVGLEQDFQTLKRRDRDGFEQALMTAVAVQLGGDLAPFLRVVFHSAHGQEVCRVIIAPAPRPVYLEQGSAPKFYLRSGATTRELNVKEAMDFQATRWTVKARQGR
jgi:hypothetical protein